MRPWLNAGRIDEDVQTYITHDGTICMRKRCPNSVTALLLVVAWTKVYVHRVGTGHNPGPYLMRTNTSVWSTKMFLQEL